MNCPTRACVLVCILACAVAFDTRAQDAVAALNRAETAYNRLETLRARFTQTLENQMLGEPMVSTGTLLLEPPSKFAMRFTDPQGDRIVSDGTWLWIFLPSSVPDQVTRQPIPSNGAATPNLLAQFVDRPLEHYRATFVGRDTVTGESVDVVHLAPLREDDPFVGAEVAIARHNGMVLRLVVVEPSGQRRTVVFERVEQNVPISESEFEFSIPAGTRIITPQD